MFVFAYYMYTVTITDNVKCNGYKVMSKTCRSLTIKLKVSSAGMLGFAKNVNVQNTD